MNKETISAWGKIGVLSFGGPASQIALMHRMVVDEKKWLTEKQFLNALNFCMLLPGPEAMQLATYAGWRKDGVLGGLTAGFLFVLPGAAIILLLASLYSAYGQLPLVASIFLGIKSAILVIVLEALIKISTKALKSALYYAIAAAAFIGIFLLQMPFPLIVLAAALIGFTIATSDTTKITTHSQSVSTTDTVKTISIWAFIWWSPIITLWLLGAEQILIDIATFFSKLAVVTFGGAYAVLAYMAQDVVEVNSWLSADQMVDGLGLAETTPGPLILVTEFVGFLAAENAGGFWLGVLGAIVTLWVTFTPCFLWIFAGAPYIEWLSNQPRLKSALSAITAAVVGVILNLSIWFSMNVMFETVSTTEYGPLKLLLPDIATINWHVVLMAILSGVLLLKLKWSVVYVLAFVSFCGFCLSLF